MDITIVDFRRESYEEITEQLLITSQQLGGIRGMRKNIPIKQL